MKNSNRTFTVIELGQGKPASIMDIRLRNTDTVEVVDHMTRSVLQMKAADVSIYRHTLHLHGKSFNLMNVRESR